MGYQPNGFSEPGFILSSCLSCFAVPSEKSVLTPFLEILANYWIVPIS